MILHVLTDDIGDSEAGDNEIDRKKWLEGYSLCPQHCQSLSNSSESILLEKKNWLWIVSHTVSGFNFYFRKISQTQSSGGFLPLSLQHIFGSELFDCISVKNITICTFTF